MSAQRSLMLARGQLLVGLLDSVTIMPDGTLVLTWPGGVRILPTRGAPAAGPSADIEEDGEP